MALTTLDPDTALIVVDLQKGMAVACQPSTRSKAPSWGKPGAGAGRRLSRTRAARGANNVAGGAPGRTVRTAAPARFPRQDGWTDLKVPELNRQPSDIVVTKRTWGAFASTDLEAKLKARDVTQVVIAGVATGTGVESTARQAYEQGFNVTLALDAITDMRAEAHDYSLKNVFPRLGETGSAEQIIALLPAGSV